MRILVNLVPISTGGGLQNTLSFLHQLPTQTESHSFTVICASGSTVEQQCIIQGIKHQSISPGKLSRIYYEVIEGYRIMKKNQASLVFSLFGGAPLFSPGIYKISGFAYSNIIQPEIPFWGFLPPLQRLKKGVIDLFRRWLAQAADEIILETDYLKTRAEGVLFKHAKLHVVKMAPSLLVTKELHERAESDKETFDILYLAGPHPNKRIHLLGTIFSQLNAGSRKFRLITTLPSNSSYYRQVELSFIENSCPEALHNIGPVSPNSVGRLIVGMDAMINVALLESFSNNWVEAWAANIPLITTDADWARASCGDAAIYIDPTNPRASAEKLLAILSNPDAIKQLVLHGQSQLQSLPTAQEKFDQYMTIINSALMMLEGRK